MKTMTEKPKKHLRISLRLRDGWSERVMDNDPMRCDLDGARLWISPGGDIYCDLIHTDLESNQVIDR